MWVMKESHSMRRIWEKGRSLPAPVRLRDPSHTPWARVSAIDDHVN